MRHTGAGGGRGGSRVCDACAYRRAYTSFLTASRAGSACALFRCAALHAAAAAVICSAVSGERRVGRWRLPPLPSFASGAAPALRTAHVAGAL